MGQANFYIKQGDRKPYLRTTLKDANGVVVNVAGCTVNFIMRENFGQPAKVSTAATIVDGPNGVVEYRWGATDTDTSGEYQGEFEVIYADLTEETFPNDGYIKVYILKGLG